MKKFKRLKNVDYQIFTGVEGPAATLELIDENGDAFLDIHMEESHEILVTFFRADISISLDELEEGLKIARDIVKVVEGI